MKERQELNDLRVTLREIFCALTKYHTDLTTNIVCGEDSVTFTVRAHKADTPKLVGKDSRIMNSFRKIAKHISLQNKMFFRYVMEEPIVGSAEARIPFRKNLQFKPDFSVNVLQKLIPWLIDGKFVVSANDFPNVCILQITVADVDYAKLVSIVDALETIFESIGHVQGKYINLDVVLDQNGKLEPQTKGKTNVTCA